MVEFSEKLIRAINHVNGDVAHELPEDADEEMIAEVCLDAHRLLTWGHPEAQTELHNLIQAHGYPAVLEEAAKHVSRA